VKVRFTPSARTQFLAAIVYIYRDNPTAAGAFRLKAEKALSRLQRFRRSGTMLPEFPDLPLREVIVAPYRFFYRVKGNTVWIVAGWHGAQLPEEPPEGENA
jgi:plasmid stabilization system protein ParE